MSSKSIARIGKNLREARETKRLTQADVAQKAGISTNYYARIERGEVAISVEVLEQLTKALGVKSASILPF